MELMVDQAMRLVQLGEAYLHSDQLELAASVARLALRNSLDYHQRGARAWSQWLFGETNAPANKVTAAGGHYFKAAALAAKLRVAPLLAHCHLGLRKA